MFHLSEIVVWKWPVSKHTYEIRVNLDTTAGCVDVSV